MCFFDLLKGRMPDEAFSGRIEQFDISFFYMGFDFLSAAKAGLIMVWLIEVTC